MTTAELKATIDEGITLMTAEFSTELSTKADPQSIDKLRAQGAKAETYGITIANWKRELSQITSELEAQRLLELRGDEDYIKMTAPEKKILLKERMKSLDAYDDYLESAQEIVKRRCSLFQTIINSLSTEQKSQWNNNRI